MKVIIWYNLRCSKLWEVLVILEVMLGVEVYCFVLFECYDDVHVVFLFCVGFIGFRVYWLVGL